MNTKPLFSICIPTYNRSDFIIKSLSYLTTIVRTEDVEVVVVDDCSTDDTNKKLVNFVRSHKKIDIRLHRLRKHSGFDKVVSSVVKIARGKYCWLISDDDTPTKDSLKKIQGILKRYPKVSLIHMNYSRFDKALKRITAKKMVGSITKDLFFDDADDFFFKPVEDSYFNFLGTNVITMSTNVVNRKMWLNAAKKVRKYVGHNFIHCFAISTMIKENPKIYYVAKPNVQYLANNHRIWPNDIWKDYNNVFLGYLRSIGYSKDRVEEMRRAQRKYEKREAAMKHPLLKYTYPFGKIIIAGVRYIKSKFS